MSKHSIFSFLLLILLCVVFTSCYVEDPGPVQEQEKQYAIADFDRLQMGDAFNITVTQGPSFNVSVKGDGRNINDLRVRKEGATLTIDFDNNHNRKHDTYIYITMPVLRAVKFSGASKSNIIGFSNLDTFYLDISGASKTLIDVDTIAYIDVTLSGASHFDISGVATALNAEVSGASKLNAFDLFVEEANVNASGASKANVTVLKELWTIASGASKIYYRGNPHITKETSGASSVIKD